MNAKPPADNTATGQAVADIDIHDLCIVFDTPAGDFTAVDRVSFQARPGEFLCLLGPSGCGKSTVLNAIAGFEPPASGQMNVLGREVRGPGPERGMVFQQPNLFPWRTVRGNIGHGPRMARKSRREIKEKTDRLIEMVGLTRFAEAYPHMLSGGMQQRVALARSLANQPQILLMDEPFGALDAQTRAMMQEHLLALWAKIGATIVFVTHDVDEAVFLADRVLIMTASPGQIRSDLTVNLARPRDVSMLSEPAFLELRRTCLEVIREESARAFAQQGVAWTPTS